MKINATTDGSVDVNKAMLGEYSAFQFEDISDTVIERKPVQPKLLSTILGAGATKDYLITNSFVFDMTEESVTLPSGISANGYGPDISKEVPKQYTYQVPYFGMRFNVAPGDYMNRRIPGTRDMMNEAYCIAAMNKKSMVSWELFDELAMAQLLTTDTNIVRNGPAPTYNFYTELVGSSRGSAVACEFDDSNTDSNAILRAQKKVLLQNIARAGMSASKVVCICGDTFFNYALEQEENSSLARPLRSTFDFASQEVTSSSFGGSWMYDNFVSSLNGIHFINYGSEIVAGTNLIADTAGYLTATGISSIHKAYAPAIDRDNVNKEAKEFYAWSTVDNRLGVTVWQQSNVFFMNSHPECVLRLTTT